MEIGRAQPYLADWPCTSTPFTLRIQCVAEDAQNAHLRADCRRMDRCSRAARMRCARNTPCPTNRTPARCRQCVSRPGRTRWPECTHPILPFHLLVQRSSAPAHMPPLRDHLLRRRCLTLPQARNPRQGPSPSATRLLPRRVDLVVRMRCLTTHEPTRCPDPVRGFRDTAQPPRHSDARSTSTYLENDRKSAKEGRTPAHACPRRWRGQIAPLSESRRSTGGESRRAWDSRRGRA